MERKIRVGIIAYELSALRGGPKFSFLVANQLQKAGFEVAMTCVHHKRDFLKAKFPFIENFKIYSAKRTFLRDRANNLNAFWNHSPSVWRMCREFKPDVVIETGGVITSLFVPWLLQIPMLHYCHHPASAYAANYAERNPIHKRIYLSIVRRLEIFFAKRTKKIISNSEFTAGVAKKLWGLDSEILNPPTDTSLFLPKQKESTILCVAFYNAYYQFEKLVEQFRKLNRADYQLYVVGPTYEQDTSRAAEYYKKLKFEFTDKNVHWLANIDFRELLDLYGRAKFFWHPGTAHFGNILAEAQSAGCATISFGRHAGPGEIIVDGKTGFLVDNFEQMREKTQDIIDDAGQLEEIARAARENSKRFSVENFRARLVAFLTGAVRR